MHDEATSLGARPTPKACLPILWGPCGLSPLRFPLIDLSCTGKIHYIYSSLFYYNIATFPLFLFLVIFLEDLDHLVFIRFIQAQVPREGRKSLHFGGDETPSNYWDDWGGASHPGFQGPKKEGSEKTRLVAVEQKIFKCQRMVERGLSANHSMIKNFIR